MTDLHEYDEPLAVSELFDAVLVDVDTDPTVELSPEARAAAARAAKAAGVPLDDWLNALIKTHLPPQPQRPPEAPAPDNAVIDLESSEYAVQ